MKEKIYNIITHSGIWIMQKIFPEYFASESLHPTDRYIEYPFVLENLPKSPCKILDIGCSGSIFPLLIKALKYDIYGIDIREYHPQGKFLFTKTNICVSPFKSDFFDVITAVSSIEHIGLKGRYGSEEDMEGDIKALKEIYRILKPSGIFLMTIPLGENLKITKNHKIYNQIRLHLLLKDFTFQYTIIKSPEGNYDLALIKAIK